MYVTRMERMAERHTAKRKSPYESAIAYGYIHNNITNSRAAYTYTHAKIFRQIYGNVEGNEEKTISV